MAEWNEVKAKYCNNCQNKEHCYTPCPLVNSALLDLPCGKQIYDMCTRTPKEEVGEVNEKEFDYGKVVYKHRFNMTRSLDDYKETTLNKCIRIGLELKYKTMACDKLVYEVQIVYKDENDKLQCLCLDLHDWTIAVKHIGDMQCNI